MTRQVIWIPCFRNQTKLNIEEPAVLSDLVIVNKSDQYLISQITEDSSFGLNYDVDFKSNVRLAPEEGEVVLETKYYMAIVHYSIVNKLNIPSIYTMISSPESWFREKE